MPHLVLDYSSNVIDPPEMRPLLVELHHALVSSGQFRIGDIKSRAVRHEIFAVAEGDDDRSMITLELQAFGGRDDETKGRIADALMEVLSRRFARALESSRCDLTIQFTDIHRESYRKRTGPGT